MSVRARVREADHRRVGHCVKSESCGRSSVIGQGERGARPRRRAPPLGLRLTQVIAQITGLVGQTRPARCSCSSPGTLPASPRRCQCSGGRRTRRSRARRAWSPPSSGTAATRMTTPKTPVMRCQRRQTRGAAATPPDTQGGLELRTRDGTGPCAAHGLVANCTARPWLSTPANSGCLGACCSAASSRQRPDELIANCPQMLRRSPASSPVWRGAL